MLMKSDNTKILSEKIIIIKWIRLLYVKKYVYIQISTLLVAKSECVIRHFYRMAKNLDKKVSSEKSWFTKRDLLESHKSMSQRAQKHFQSIEAIRWFWKTLLHISCFKWNGNNGVLLFLNILIYIVSLILYFCKVVKYIWKRFPKFYMV